MNKTQHLAIIALFSALLLPISIQAKVYKWVDAQGVTHYTTKPPPPGAKVVSPTPPTPQKSALPAAAAPAPAAAPLQQPIAAPPSLPQTSAIAPASVRQPIERNCSTARNNLTILQRHTEVTLSRDKHKKPLTPEQHRIQLMQAEKDVEYYCNHSAHPKAHETH